MRYSLPKRKVPKKRKTQEDIHYCDDCALKHWNTTFDNLDLEGNPITMRCPNYEKGNIGIIRGSKACDKFVEKS